MSNYIYCLIGPSGSGKSTIAKSLPYESIKCYCTRAMRKGEKEGEEKFFISKEEFMKIYPQMIAHTNYAGNYYGITQGEIIGLENGPLVYVVDLKGYRDLQTVLPKLKGYEDVKVVSIFIKVPKNELEKRLIQQGRSSEEIKIRLHRYNKDNAAASECDWVIENRHNQLQSTVNTIQKLIESHETI